MTTPINLNKARKQKKRADAEKKATENRVKFGRTKSQKDLEKSEAARARRNLEASKLEH
tara:strand:- start:130 stop:306 length:177 start_codon:yes stop_codon:yes gene_type:complete